jgi:hypothetical protein
VRLEVLSHPFEAVCNGLQPVRDTLRKSKQQVKGAKDGKQRDGGDKNPLHAPHAQVAGIHVPVQLAGEDADQKDAYEKINTDAWHALCIGNDAEDNDQRAQACS